MNIWANCDNCKHYATGDKRCHECLATRPPSKWEAGANYEPPTNADRIRAMTDKELAEWALYKAPEIGREYNDSFLGLIKWLQQPAEGE